MRKLSLAFFLIALAGCSLFNTPERKAKKLIKEWGKNQSENQIIKSVSFSKLDTVSIFPQTQKLYYQLQETKERTLEFLKEDTIRLENLKEEYSATASAAEKFVVSYTQEINSSIRKNVTLLETTQHKLDSIDNNRGGYKLAYTYSINNKDNGKDTLTIVFYFDKNLHEIVEYEPLD